MPKRKRNTAQRPAAQRPATPSPRVMRDASAPRARSSWVWIVVPIVMLLVGLGGLLWWFTGSAAQPTTQTNLRVGGVEDCRILPKFPAAFGFPGPVLISTSERQTKGLVMLEQNPTQQDANGNPVRRRYQHPSWTQAGWLGAPVFDKLGNVYVAPAPFISLLDNPPEKQNIIYKVDGNTGEMKAFATLPAAAPPSVDNPYGLLGLTYDCESNTLYASSVSGSTRDQERGRLFHINADTGAILGQRDDVDGFGVAVFNSPTGKRLYYGLARSSEVRYLALDSAGNFIGTPQVAFTLVDLGPRGDDHARRITITNASEMIVRGMTFEFNLVAASERQQTAYHFQYDQIKDSWNMVSSEPIQ